jgi:hypothetical protein
VLSTIWTLTGGRLGTVRWAGPELATTLGGAQGRFAITDEQDQLSHCEITTARLTGAPGCMAACRATVELPVSTACLAAFDEA